VLYGPNSNDMLQVKRLTNSHNRTRDTEDSISKTVQHVGVLIPSGSAAARHEDPPEAVHRPQLLWWRQRP